MTAGRADARRRHGDARPRRPPRGPAARGVHAAPPPEHGVRQRARVPGRRGRRGRPRPRPRRALSRPRRRRRPPRGSASPSGGRAFWVAAVREAFEEAGVLLARTPTGDAVRFDDDPDDARPASTSTGARCTPATRSFARRARPTRTSCSPSMTCATSSHWITPEGEPKRFDTRFFLARAPEGQAYAHDDGELIGSEWVRPADALAPPPGGRLRHDRPHRS